MSMSVIGGGGGGAVVVVVVVVVVVRGVRLLPLLDTAGGMVRYRGNVRSSIGSAMSMAELSHSTQDMNMSTSEQLSRNCSSSARTRITRGRLFFTQSQQKKKAKVRLFRLKLNNIFSSKDVNEH